MLTWSLSFPFHFPAIQREMILEIPGIHEGVPWRHGSGRGWRLSLLGPSLSPRGETFGTVSHAESPGSDFYTF